MPVLLVEQMIPLHPTTVNCQQSLCEEWDLLALPTSVMKCLWAQFCSVGFRQITTAAVSSWGQQLCHVYMKNLFAICFFNLWLLPSFCVLFRECYPSLGAGNIAVPFTAEQSTIMNSLHFGRYWFLRESLPDAVRNSSVCATICGDKYEIETTI